MSQSKHHHSHAPHPNTPRRSPAHLMAWYFAILGMVLLLFWAISKGLSTMNGKGVVVPDEKAVAAGLLAQQFTGPRYFQIPAGDARDSSGVKTDSAPAEPHITAAAARKQIDAIAQARHLSGDGAIRLRELFERLTELPNSRVVGEEHLNLLRLNLALDELK